MRKISLKKKLISIFAVTSMVSIILFGFFMSYSTFMMLKKNTENLMQMNMKQMNDNIQILIKSYEDLLYQAYTEDDMILWLEKLNNDQDIAVTTGQIRRYLQGLLNAKDYIRAITVVSKTGKVVTYDQLTPATYESSWISNFSKSREELYEEVSQNNYMHVYSTEYATTFANEDYYLFHLAHRIIDYKDLEKENGIVIVSLDERLLNSVLQMEKDGLHYTFLADNQGQIISALDKHTIGSRIEHADGNVEDKTNAYKSFLSANVGFAPFSMSFGQYHDELHGWDIVSMTDQRTFMQEIIERIGMIIVVSLLTLFMDVLLVLKLSGNLVDSVEHIVLKMKEVEGGDLFIRIPLEKKMPLEIETIVKQFNGTLEKLGIAVEKQKVAEIKALEAQINPHFLYNTLDTINWMAIEKDEYDISNAINSLANILRYAISNYSEIVEIREEMEWLKQYIFLQQYRFKNKFICNINVEPEVMNHKIHKLMFQPFVENAIVHGFAKKQEQYLLEVKVQKIEDNKLEIVIRDNGKGMNRKVVERINSGLPVSREEKEHIGIDNAISRIHMYCKAKEKIFIKSRMDEGTEITIWIPL